MYNNPQPNNYDPSQDNIKAKYFNNLVYQYNGAFVNYTETIDVVNYQQIFKFRYFFRITDKTTRSPYNNDTFLCDQISTVNPYAVSGLEHAYSRTQDYRLYFYNNQCGLSYPNIDRNWSYNVAAVIMLALVLMWICVNFMIFCMIIGRIDKI